MPRWIEKLKDKWKLKSFGQVVIILIVFSLTGLSVVFLKDAFFNLAGFNSSTPSWIKIVSYLAVVFPAYQLLLLAYGFLFGQFNFFWEKEKKLFHLFRKLCTRRN